MSDQTYERILDATVEVLAEVRRPTSKLITAIAARARVSRPTIYRLIGDQPALFVAVLRRELRRRVEIEIVPALNGLQEPHDDLVRTLLVMIRMVISHPVVTFLMENHPATVVSLFPELGDILVDAGHPIVEPIFKEAAAAGRMPPVDAREFLLVASRFVVGYVVIPEKDQSDVALAASVERLFTVASSLPMSRTF